MTSCPNEETMIHHHTHTPTPTPDDLPLPQRAQRKPKPKFLSFFLQSIIMLCIITLFFLFLGIATVFIIHICIAGRTLHRRTRHTSSSSSFPFDYIDAEFNHFSSSGISEHDINKLPSYGYISVVKLLNCGATQEDCCAVCLDGFRENERFRILPGCKHVFHVGCIDVWLMKVSACPTCRSVVELN